MFFFTKTPKLIQRLFPRYLWKINTSEKSIYLTFDDGPVEGITDWILDELKKYNAKASFFCLGKNTQEEAEIFNRIKLEGHTIGNHGFNHLNAWKTSFKDYMKDFKTGKEINKSSLFRPPYGKLNQKIAQKIINDGNQIVLWDIMPGDWKEKWSSEKILHNILKNIECGSIVVLHDNEKAFKHLKYILPQLLQTLDKEGYLFKAL